MPTALIHSRFGFGSFHDICLAALEHATQPWLTDEFAFADQVRTWRSLITRGAELRKRGEVITSRHPEAKAAVAILAAALDDLARATDLSACQALWERVAQSIERLDRTQGRPSSPLSSTSATPSTTIPGSPFFRLDTDYDPTLPLLLRCVGSTLPISPANSFGEIQTNLSDHQRFIAAVTSMCAAYRTAGSPPFHRDDLLALERAFQLVETCQSPARLYHPILTDRRRSHQTYLALADPGPGHLAVTAMDNDLMRGTIVHIEYIDRGGIPNKSVIEAYRIPSVRDVARLRVCVGAETPCSVYIGRPVFELPAQEARGAASPPRSNAEFEMGLLKAVHTMAAACSSMFSYGVAECKIGMDGMTAAQALRFMQCLAGNVIRDRFTQRLSAAFNINTPIFYDLDPGRPGKWIQPGRIEIAKLGIDLARRGRFDKVTWDGAANEASQPIIGQLKRSELLELVHEAHSAGLETYISAGMEAVHMTAATWCGVGGVGIGTKLHRRHPQTDAIADLIPQSIRDVLLMRDGAADQPAGKAAALLAQLDWLFHANGPESGLEPLRHQLFSVLREFLAAVDADNGAGAVRQRELNGELTRLSEQIKPRLPPISVPAPQAVRSSTALLPVDPVVAQAVRVIENAKRSGHETDPDIVALAGDVERGDVESIRACFGR